MSWWLYGDGIYDPWLYSTQNMVYDSITIFQIICVKNNTSLNAKSIINSYNTNTIKISAVIPYLGDKKIKINLRYHVEYNQVCTLS